VCKIYFNRNLLSTIQQIKETDCRLRKAMTGLMFSELNICNSEFFSAKTSRNKNLAIVFELLSKSNHA